MSDPPQPVLDPGEDFLAENLTRSGLARVTEQLAHINAGRGRHARRLASYRDALVEWMEDSAPGGGELVAVELGAGNLFLFNYLLLRSVAGDRDLRYVAVDEDPLAQLQHRSTCRGREIQYLVGDASDRRWLQDTGAIPSTGADLLFLDHPVICPPETYLASRSAGEARMVELLARPRYAAQVRRQHRDFESMFAEVIPRIVRPGGLILATALLPVEVAALRRLLEAPGLSSIHHCLVAPPAARDPEA